MPVIAIHEPSLDYGGRLSAQVGGHAALYDQYVFTICDRITDTYEGGEWHMVEFKDPESELTGFYLQLKSDETFNISISSNYFEGSASSDALSIIVNLVALNTLCWKNPDDENLYNLYHALRYWACGHEESATILGAID